MVREGRVVFLSLMPSAQALVYLLRLVRCISERVELHSPDGQATRTAEPLFDRMSDAVALLRREEEGGDSTQTSRLLLGRSCFVKNEILPRSRLIYAG